MGATRRTLTIFPPIKLSSVTTLAQQRSWVKCRWEMSLALASQFAPRTVSPQENREGLAESGHAVGGSSAGRVIALLELLFPLLITGHDLPDVRACFMEPRDAAVPLDVAFAGVVGRDRVLQVSVETALEVLQVLHA